MIITKYTVSAALLKHWGHKVIVRERIDDNGTLRSYITDIDDRHYKTNQQTEAKQLLNELLEVALNECKTSEENC